MQNTKSIIYNIDEISAISSDLLAFYNSYKIFSFTGNLGSGKTTLITALSKLLGSDDTVSSPTFSLVNEYTGSNTLIYHFDLYRLKNLEEALDIGFEEYIYSNNYCFIEWPQKITDILPQGLVVFCNLEYISPNERSITTWINS